MSTSFRKQRAILPLAVVAIAGTISTARAQELRVTALAPDSPQDLRLAQPISREEMERLFELKERIRERMAEGAAVQPGAVALPLIVGRPTEAVDASAQYPGLPEVFRIGRNNKNTNANNAVKGSTLAEPAASNEGARVLAAGNFNHAEYSTNGGSTWIDIPLPAGPADAPTLCCDNEIVYDQARGLWILASLYINGAATNGVVRLFVFRTLPNYSCSYTIDQGGASNVLMDFPHIALSNKFLYLASNDIGGTPSQSARMRRFDLDQMADCVTVSSAHIHGPIQLRASGSGVPFKARRTQCTGRTIPTPARSGSSRGPKPLPARRTQLAS